MTEGVGGVEYRAVNVELALPPGLVSDPYGSAATPARQVGHLAFGEVAAALDAEHDLQVQAAIELRRRCGG